MAGAKEARQEVAVKVAALAGFWAAAARVVAMVA